MKTSFPHLALNIIFLALGLTLGWYFTSSNIPAQYNCYDIGSFHQDYLLKHFPQVEDVARTSLNRQLREICFTNPESGLVEYRTPGE